jgi:hypothetical protein
MEKNLITDKIYFEVNYTKKFIALQKDDKRGLQGQFLSEKMKSIILGAIS